MQSNLWKHNTTNNSIWREQAPNKANPVRIWSPYAESKSRWIPKFNGNFLVQRYTCNKITTTIQSVFPEIWAKWWENALSHNVEKILQNIHGYISTDGWPPKFKQFFRTTIHLQ